MQPCGEDMMFQAITSSSFVCNVSENQTHHEPGRGWTVSPAHVEPNWTVQQSECRLASVDAG